MADDTTTSTATPDPSVDPVTGQPLSFFDRLGKAFSNPLVQGLMGMSQGFGQAAMPTRMPIPFGAAFGMGMGGFGQGLSNAYKTRLEAAQAQGEQIKNELAYAQLPYQRAQAQALTQLYRMNPEQLRQYFGGGAGTTTPNMAPQLPGQGAAPSTPAGPAPFVGSNLPKDVTPAEDQLVRTVYGEARGEPLAGQQAVASVIKTRMRLGNQDVPGVVFAPNQFEAWSDPKNRPAMEALDPNSPAYQSILTKVVRPVMSGEAQDPTGGATNFYNPQLQSALGRSTPAFAQGNQTTIGNHTFFYGGYAPQQARAPGQGGSYQVAQAGGGVQPPPGQGGAAAGSEGGYGSLTPGNAFQMSAQLNAEAARQERIQLQLKSMPALAPLLLNPASGVNLQDPTALRQRAQTLLEYALAPGKAGNEEAARQAAQTSPQAIAGQAALAGAKTGAEQQVHLAYDPVIEAEKKRLAGQYEPTNQRPGSVARVNIGGEMKWVGSPAQDTVQAPDGTSQHVWVTPPTPDHPAPVITPMIDPRTNQPLVEKIAPQLQEQRTEASKDFATKGTESFSAAQNTQAWLNQIDNAARTMNRPGGPGFLNTGPFADLRLGLVSKINDALRTAGARESTLIDPAAIGSWEELKKATTTAGFELSSKYEGHARQAAATISNATSAVPGEHNSPQGMINVSAGIREGSNTAIDEHTYADTVNRLTNGAGLPNAPVDFYKAVPATMYANRAISILHPVTITDQKDLDKYLPGTFFVTPGKPGVRQVPDRTIEIGTVDTAKGPVAVSMPFTAPDYMKNYATFAAQAGASGG